MDYVTARRAADMTGMNERTIRRHITSGKLPAERGPDGDYRIPTSALTQLRRQAKDRATRRGDLPGQLDALRSEVEALRATVEALRATVEALQGRIETLEAPRVSRYTSSYTPIAPVSRSGGQETAMPATDAQSLRPRPYRRLEPHRGASFVQPVGPDGDFATHADALRWLQRHGNMGEGTPKTWPGWREVTLTPPAVLALAIERCDVGNHRIPWRLHRCDDPECVCQTTLT